MKGLQIFERPGARYLYLLGRNCHGRFLVIERDKTNDNTRHFKINLDQASAILGAADPFQAASDAYHAKRIARRSRVAGSSDGQKK